MRKWRYSAAQMVVIKTRVCYRDRKRDVVSYTPEEPERNE